MCIVPPVSGKPTPTAEGHPTPLRSTAQANIIRRRESYETRNKEEAVLPDLCMAFEWVEKC